MPINKEALEQLRRVDKLYQLIYDLQGTEDFHAYESLFQITSPDPQSHYGMLNDGKNRQLMVALYQGTNPSIEQLAEATGLKPNDITARIELFKANGMKSIRIRNAA